MQRGWQCCDMVCDVGCVLCVCCWMYPFFQVLHLAMHARKPKVQKQKKEEWWAVSDFLWGYLDHEHFGEKPDFVPLRGSKSKFMFQTRAPSSINADAGRVDVRTKLCMCSPCRPCSSGSDFVNCELRADPYFRKVVGTTRMHTMHRRNQVAHDRRTRAKSLKALDIAPGVGEDPDALKEFADTFMVGEVVAVAVSEVHKEEGEFTHDDFWLAVVEGMPQKMQKDERFAAMWLGKGRLAFDCQWLEKVQTNLDDQGEVESITFKVTKDGKRKLDVGTVLQLPPVDADSQYTFNVIGVMRTHQPGDKFELDSQQLNHIINSMELPHRGEDAAGAAEVARDLLRRDDGDTDDDDEDNDEPM